MDSEVANLARRAAAEVGHLDPGVVPQVEAAIATHGQDDRPERFDPATLLGLAGLILAVAQFAYAIQRDHKADARLSADVLRRQVRLKLDQQGHPDTDRRSAIIDAVVRVVEEAGR